MKKTNYLILLLLLIFSYTGFSQSKAVIADTDAWIAQLDTSVNAAQKEQLRAWIYEGLSVAQMESTCKLYPSAGEFFKALNTSKSIFHRRVLINDQVENIPGIAKGAYVANGLQRASIPARPASPTLDLPASEAPNFVSAIDTLLGEGTKIYRVIGGSGSYPTGGYWVASIPTSYDEIIGGTAVQPEWNGLNEIVEFTVPAGGMVVWKGKAATQPIAGNSNKFVTTYVEKYYLAGGIEQLFVPNVYRDFKDPIAYNKFLGNITKKAPILWKKN